MTAAAQPELLALLREQVPRVLGAVARRCSDFAAAEDAVQDALLQALAAWPAGRPANPGGWLYHVACRRLADHRDSERTRRHREATVAQDPAIGTADVHDDLDDDLLRDDTLPLLFTCCHPALTEPTAVALTLRAVGGLTTAEIAAAFLVPEATMAQRIGRAKQTIADSGIPLALPDPPERPARLRAVLHVLYLIFNEGHVASAGAQLVRVELATEAIRLARLLHRLLPDDGEVAGLLALLLLTDARRGARTGPGGELVPLDEQDRGRWDRAAIAEGSALVTAAFHRGNVGAFQLQAAIAALHDEAPSVAATDWPQILALYDVLRRLADNPAVELNRVVALAMVHGPVAGLARLDELAQEPRLQRSHRPHAIRGHLLAMAGDHAAAAACFRAAASHADNLAERAWLLRKAASSPAD
jgi:RNA polymerase sigma factor (sigma-70 family)